MKYLFITIFTIQIFFISYYLAQKYKKVLNKIYHDHPIDQYPKFYPQPAEIYAEQRNKFELANRFLIVMGVLLLVYITFGGHKYYHLRKFLNLLPLIFGFLQIFPYIYMDICSIKKMKRMRSNVNQQIEKTDFKLWDLIKSKPYLAMISLFTLILYILIGGATIASHSDSYRFFVLLSINILIHIGSILVLKLILISKKSNPFMAWKDYKNELNIQVGLMLLSSTVFSCYLILLTLFNGYHWRNVVSTIGCSFYIALFFTSVGYMLNKYKPGEVDYSVYK